MLSRRSTVFSLVFLSISCASVAQPLPLIEAVNASDADSVRVLAPSASPEVRERALTVAADSGDVLSAQALIDGGPFPLTRGLRAAARAVEVEIVKLLLDRGADPTDAIFRSLTNSRVRGRDAEILEIATSYGLWRYT